METLFERFRLKLAHADTQFVRSLMDCIAWEARLIGIKGARGVGKTMLLLQYIKLHTPMDASVLYVSLDHIWFTEHRLYDLADDFVKRGGKHLFLDEVHKYSGWAQELKNMYDDFPELRVVFTGSSLLEILNASADLSRRSIVYEMQGFSFREFLNRNAGTAFPVFAWDDVLKNHTELSEQVVSNVKILPWFDDYLKHGYYPFYNELPSLYLQRVEEVVNMIVEIELPLLRQVNPAYTRKIRQLLLVIAESVPFIPNISKLSERIGLSRVGLLYYLKALEEARLTIHLEKDAFGLTRLQKPEKIFLENTNLMYSLSPESVNRGSLRETFFINQVGFGHRVLSSFQSDFLVDGKFTMEIGGKDKAFRQLNGIEQAFVAADDIEYGMGKKIPLWLFGFLY